MKRKGWMIFLVSLILFSTLGYSQQSKKATLMILPSDNWCTQRFFTKTYEGPSGMVKYSDFQRAFQEDIELNSVLVKVKELLTNCGYSVKDCEQELKNLAQRAVEDNATMSKNSGASLKESTLDVLKRRTKADIIVYVDWVVNREGNQKSINFMLQAVDSYTSKVIASTSGLSSSSSESIPRQLENSIKGKVNMFDNQMYNHFLDMQRNGREIVLTIRCWDNWDVDLETEYMGNELIDCIQSWMRNNTVNGAFNLTDATENFAQFEQVRIPLMDENGVALDARAYATKLRKFLSKEPYLITSKVLVRGLGEAIVVLGEK